jgi:CheY-like chemotaxis protein
VALRAHGPSGKGRTGASRSASHGRTAGARTRRVLLADDHKDGADSLAELLRLKGHDVFVVYDGEQAVDLAGTVRPDVMLLDLAMPKLTGYEAAERIRRQPWGAGILIIAITGWGQAEMRRQSRESGFDHHLVKPIELSTLQALLTAPPSTPEA